MSYYLTQERLIERGWTKGLIQKRLGEPDKTKRNPHYPYPHLPGASKYRIRLYSLQRVLEQESIPEISLYITKTLLRRQTKKIRQQSGQDSYYRSEKKPLTKIFNQ